MLSSLQGFPRLGVQRELKFAVEAFWRGDISEDELERKSAALRRENYQFLNSAGLDMVPVGDFSYYDKMLDTIAMTGAVPARFPFAGQALDLERYFAMARGAKGDSGNVRPLSMLKWFNTNYHYMVPEFSERTTFKLAPDSLLALVDEALEQGVPAMPVLIGPLSFLLLGRGEDGFDTLNLLDSLLPVYRELLGKLAGRAVNWIQLDEPCFAADYGDSARAALAKACGELKSAAGEAKLVIQTYFDHVGPNYDTLTNLPVDGIGLDFVHGPENLELIRGKGFPADKTLFAGVVDGRNIWVCDPDAVLELVSGLGDAVGEDKLALSSSCSLMHVPVTMAGEDHLPREVQDSMAFAREKVSELTALARTVAGNASDSDRAVLDRSRRATEAAAGSALKNVPSVRERMNSLSDKDFSRSEPFETRIVKQNEKLGLPLFPTTTIGSFPQTREVRRLRARLRKGELTQEEYDRQIAKLVDDLVELQEEYGIDVLVHGEFERNDMVEYFGEQLEGYYFTRNGWVISYGSRGVKPPVIYGDVHRRGPMTVRWSEYAQSRTRKPMKGMLTGPVTMLNWSFVRSDIPRGDVCRQIALAIRDELTDLEKAGIGVVQVDEPALREGLPLQKDKQDAYLKWAVDAFRLSAGGADSSTQVHSHMCYSDFNTIIEQIEAMDADVISIENSRAGGQLLQVFRDRKYPNHIGPGVWDIHSPLVPTTAEMVEHLHQILEYLPPENVWVNPDCGLKTRGWEEVKPSLRNMVDAVRQLRREHGGNGAE
ncbi:MAG: 5-methyltetrahydropteroyltriglutamate--homocysteine S-methyltransferase [Candidatus Glassbacteria bacterium]|nr:5-methyltetrahydropteroyltriglutamate--homocysteine S-methyltransferase [Candidatus Glassbacteria bacterium]